MAALAVVGFLLYRGLFGGGGAGSPQEAAQRLGDALAAEDFAGLIELLPPEEVSALDDIYDASLERAEREGFVESQEDPIMGMDLTVQNLETRVEQLHPQVARVSIIGGTFGYRLDPAQLPPQLRDSLGSQAVPLEGTVTAQQIRQGLTQSGASFSDLYFVAVERDGGWYMSLYYTLAQYWQEGAGLPAADFSASREDVPEGADSAPDAVRAFLSATGSVDIDGIIASMPPTEMGVVYDYRAALVQAIGPENIERARSAVTITYADVQVREEPFEEGVKVILERVTGSVTSGDETTVFQIEGGCFTMAGGEPQCLRDVPGLQDAEVSLFLVAVEEDSGWYVSPIKTLEQYAILAVDSLNAEDLPFITG